jgi:hypothetical protein
MATAWERVEKIRTAEDFADAVADSIKIGGFDAVIAPAPSVEGTGTVEHPDD